MTSDPYTAERPLTWGELDAPRRRRRLAWSTLNIVVRTCLLVLAYYLAPFENAAESNLAVRVGASLLIVVAAAAIALVGIVKADFPIIRAIEGMSTFIVVTLLLFASTFVLMSRGDPLAFSEHLDHTGALYFVVTTASTIGYGDIAPRTEPARIAVMIQMITNVFVLGVGLRLMLNTAKRRARST